MPMLWACSGAVAIHVAAACLLGTPHWGSGVDSLVAQHAIVIRYLPEESPRSPSTMEVASVDVPVAAPIESLPSLQKAGSSSTETGQPRRYFDVSEVDQPAMPTPDWALDPSMLVRNAVRSLKVEVLVSETGRPERCTVLSMEPAKPTLHSTIQRQLCATRLTPAIRYGVAVPSVRHVEIVLSQE